MSMPASQLVKTWLLLVLNETKFSNSCFWTIMDRAYLLESEIITGATEAIPGLSGFF